MAKHKYEIARGDYSLPAQSYESGTVSDKGRVSPDTAQRYLFAIRNIVDECVNKRVADGQDILKAYNAEIVSMNTVPAEVGSVTVGEETYSVTRAVPTYIRVRYNDDDYTDISSATVGILSPADKWCKICTYDGVQFYVLHKL